MSAAAGATRTAVTLAVAGAVSASALTESGHAATRPTAREVKERVDDLYRQAETATQEYDGVSARAAVLRREVSDLQDQLARRTRRTEEIRDDLGRVAAAQYRSGGFDPTLRLMLSADPSRYLSEAGMVERVDSREAAAVSTLAARARQDQALRDQAAGDLATLTADEHRLAADRRAVEGRLGAARRLLSRLTSRQRAAVAGGADAVPGSAAAVPGAPGRRAAEAVAFAYAQLGKPYVWGATGPAGYDCSGLTQASWAAAGVALPRTTYTQIDAGTRVPESRLEPGDLVFYYAGISHVGIYVGDGRIIHAPHPGAPVQLAPVGEMPFMGATRPA